MSPRKRLAAAAWALDPLEQGDLDSLCGLYAVINAVRLALYPRRILTRGQLNALFESGLWELQRSRRLRDTMLFGMTERTWLRMSQAVVDEARLLTGCQLCLVPVPSWAMTTSLMAVRTINDGVRQGYPVLLGLQGRLNHWTVVVRYSRARLSFFDSAQHRWVARRAVGLASDAAAHGIIKHGIVFLRPP